MLQTIRERAQGWIAWLIVILISIPFALWGIQSYLGVGSEPVAATVNGVEITQRAFDYQYQDFRRRLREQLGESYRPELFDDKVTRAQVLDRMIRDTLLRQASESLGLRASDQELRTAIMTNAAFQKNGGFDKATYERMLELQGMVPVQYEDGLRQRIVGTQLARALVATELALDNELEDEIRLDRQQRRVTYVRVPKSAFRTDEPISDEEVSAYYESHRAQFQIPERIRVQYLVLDSDSIVPEQKPGDDELRERYEAEKKRFVQPERRRVRHILIALDADADAPAERAAKERIAKIRERVEGGEDFAALARELSQDPGSAGQGGDLGLIEQGLMDPAFDQAAFALDKGQLSAPVRSRFGYHLIEVTEIEAGRQKPFEEVADQLAAEIGKGGVEGQFYDLAERLANLSYESPDSLEPAAEALGLELESSDWIDRSGGEGILAYPKVVAAAFSDEVLKEGNNSDLIEPERNRMQAIVLRVLAHEEAAAKPLSEVHDEIVAILQDKRAADAASAKAAELVDTLTAGADLKASAGDFEVKELGLVGRDASKVPEAIPAEARDYAFQLPRPQPDGKSIGSLRLAGGDAAVVVVTAVVDGVLTDMDEAARDRARRNLARGIGSAYYEDLLADLENRADVERNPVTGATDE